ncbi:uncharacterized protein LOC134844440 isoform X2 [Symsagittifera roscoffensis]
MGGEKEEEEEEEVGLKAKVVAAIILLCLLSLCQSFTVYSKNLYIIYIEKDQSQGQSEIQLFQGGLFSNCEVFYYGSDGDLEEIFNCPDSVTIQFAQAFFILANFAGVFLVVWYVCMLICTGAKWEARLKSKLPLIFSFVYSLLLCIGCLCFTIMLIQEGFKIHWAGYVAWAAFGEAFIAMVVAITLPSIEDEEKEKNKDDSEAITGDDHQSANKVVNTSL